MAQTLTHKILSQHLVSGRLKPVEELALRVDQALFQDATGTVACLAFEALGLPRIRIPLGVIYVDHNLLQTGFENADDHRFLQTFAARYGLKYSRPGDGICHQVHLQRFAVPGELLIGADSHTPMAGALGMLAFGAGGLEVALALAGEPYGLPSPKVVEVELLGSFPRGVSAKEVILDLLRRLTVQGGVGKIFEFTGPGVHTLSVSQRATIANMVTELGATSALFPSDERTEEFLKAQGRVGAYVPLAADPGAAYDETLTLDLSALEPLIALPGSPDRVVPLASVEGTPVDQVCIGSCQNSSWEDLAQAASILRGQTVHPRVSLTVSPGSRQVLELAARTGVLADLVSAGARILEAACGPCIGMGQAPATGAVSVRTFNRNFPGRSGTPEDQVYLASPEVAAAAALTGALIDPRRLDLDNGITDPGPLPIDDRLILEPAEDPETVNVIRGPNIKPLPTLSPLPQSWETRVLLVVGDNISTDQILPAGARVLPLRSNIPALAEFTLARLDPEFVSRAKAQSGGVIVAGENYGQGSSREHAALCPRYLGVRAVLARSFARIHRANLINWGIIPLELPASEPAPAQGDLLRMEGLREQVAQAEEVTIPNLTQERTFTVGLRLTPREREILLAGGRLALVRGRTRTSTEEGGS